MAPQCLSITQSGSGKKPLLDLLPLGMCTLLQARQKPQERGEGCVLLQVWGPGTDMSVPPLWGLPPSAHRAWRERTALPVTFTPESPRWNLLGLVPSPQCSRAHGTVLVLGTARTHLQNLLGLVRNRDKESGWGMPGVQASRDILGGSRPGQEGKGCSRRGLSEDGHLRLL